MLVGERPYNASIQLVDFPVTVVVIVLSVNFSSMKAKDNLCIHQHPTCL